MPEPATMHFEDFGGVSVIESNTLIVRVLYM
jgi:hypothetical protein